MKDTAQSILEKAPVADLSQNIAKLDEILDIDARINLQRNNRLPFTVLEPKDKDERPFLCCDFNSVNGKYRSPWTNKLHPKSDTPNTDLDDSDLRAFEVTFNEVWTSYKNLYYGHEALSSVYFQKTDKNFEGLFCISKKSSNGKWESCSHVVVDAPGEKDCQYTVHTTVIVILEPEMLDISSKVEKTTTKTCKINPAHLEVSHIENLGEMLESNEMDVRSNLERVLIPKNQEIISNIQKKKTFRPPTNPLMGMVMNSDILKKKLNKG